MTFLPRPLRASVNGWRWLGVYPLPTGGQAHGWSHDEHWLRCLSAVEMVEQNPPGSGLVVPHFHVSVTFSCALTGVRRAATDQEVELVRAAFGLAGAEEDNHGPGIARHLWIACGREKEPACPCKQDEQRIGEGDRVRHEPETSPAAAAPQEGPAGGLVPQREDQTSAAGTHHREG
jgi:hypothetical protein